MFRLPPLTPLVRAMLIALLAIFVTAAVLENFLGIPVVRWLWLDTRHLGPLTLLQLVAHVWIVPPEPLATVMLMVNGYILWMIVVPFEERYGARRTFELTLVAALAAGIPALLVGLVAPGLASPLAGPQTITLCAVSAYAQILPAHSRVNFFGLTLLPRQLLFALLGFSVLGFITSRPPNAAALAADLGAIGGGMAFVRWWMQRPPPRKSTKKGPAHLRVVRRDEDPKRWLN